MSLLNGSGGSVELPEPITLYCPQCGTECADKGQCLLELVKVPAENKKKFSVLLVVDCRNCMCRGESPAVDF